MSRTGALAKSAFVSLWLPTLCIGAWWLLSAGSTSSVFPPLSEILLAFKDDWLFAHFTSDFLPSARVALEALVISLVVGVGLGTPLGSNATAERAFRPLLDFLRAIPKVLLISPALLIIGIGENLSLFVLVAGAVWPILLATIDGVRGIAPNLHDLRRVYRLSRRDWFTRVALRAASPQIMAGTRTSLSLLVVLLVDAEAVGATRGIGFQIRQDADGFQFAQVWAALFAFGLLGYIFNRLFRLVEARVLGWVNGQGATR